jgi:hypothetical protein
MKRTLTEILVLVTLSAVITIGTAVLGARLMAPPPPAERAPLVRMDMACLDEPFVSVHGTIVGALARLCIDGDTVRPRVELTGLTSGTVFTAWLAYAERRSAARRERCVVDDVPLDAPWALPRRVDDVAVADQAGHVEITGRVEALHLAGGSEIQVIVVDHGWMSRERRAGGAEELLAWQRSWTQDPAASIGDVRVRGWVKGCAVFKLNVGVDSLND